MPYESEFQTLAEIAVAMAGFAGIVTAFVSSRESMSPGQVARLRELLLTSLGVVFFSFFPKLLAGVFEDPVWSFQVPQLVFAVFHITCMIIFLRTAGFSEPSAFEWLVMPPALTVLGIQFATGLGYFSDYLPEAYFLALIWLLFVGAHNFYILILSIRQKAA